jgi:NADPH:quinone reductase-like Zn-dependent oxidoreductase
MKAAVIDRYGRIDAVRVADIDVPTLGANDLLVRVHAASVNPVDIKTLEGKVKTLFKFRFPLVLGNDLAGVVVDVGERVRRFKKGDAVYARVDKNRIGTFAELRRSLNAPPPSNPTT